MEKLEELRREAKTFFGNVDPSHDWLHVKRVLKLSEEIAEKENVDRETVKSAVLLHDIGRKREDNGEIDDHAEWGAEKAEEILEEMNFNQNKIREIKHCIRTHRDSTGPEPETLEAKTLCDADNLDALGATGIARTFSVGGERQDAIADPDLPVEKDETSTGKTTLNHFYKKILELKTQMYTETGREIAEERHEYTRKFVERLEKELDGKK